MGKPEQDSFDVTDHNAAGIRTTARMLEKAIGTFIEVDQATRDKIETDPWGTFADILQRAQSGEFHLLPSDLNRETIAESVFAEMERITREFNDHRNEIAENVAKKGKILSYLGLSRPVEAYLEEYDERVQDMINVI